MQTFKSVRDIYLPITKKYKKDVYVTLFSYAVATLVAATAAPLALKEIIDTVSAGTTPTQAWSTLVSLFILLTVARITTFICWRIGDASASRFQTSAMRDISNNIFKKLSQHSYEFFSHHFVGSLVSNHNKLVRSYETVADFIAYNLLAEGSRVLIYAGVLLYLSPILGFTFIGLIIAYAIVYSFHVRTKLPIDEKRNIAESKTTGVLADALTNILTIKTFSQHVDEQSHFGSYTEQERVARYNSWHLSNVQRAVQRIALTTFELTALGTSLYLWYTGSITPGTIVLLQLYMLSAIDTILNVSRNLTRTIGAFSDAQMMADTLALPVSIQDPKHAEVSRMQTGRIDIRDISFAYEGNSEVFTNFSLSIPAGQKVGLVGHSGSGKTTITKLLLRFLDVQRGSIQIDGQDIRNVKQDDLREAIAYVPQEPLLFHRTIGENIAYGKPDATQGEIEAVAQRAHAHEFISRLPLAYDTLVGERGVRLSGGERQRVAIARAMIKNAPILLLDEATSALDSLSESHIAEAFDEAMRGRTTIVIAHRLSTIQKMDRIIVFDKGTIVEDGTHADLLALNGTYAELWKQQAGGFIQE